MSYLHKDSGGPSGSKAIVSVWVRCGGVEYLSSPFPKDCIPGHIEQEMVRGEALVNGGSYYASGFAFDPPRILTYPLKDKTTWWHGMVPFLTWGKTDQPYEMVEWKKKVIEEDYYYFGPNGGHKKLVSQYPEKGEPKMGIVPPSMIGSRNGQLVIVLQTSSKAKYTGYCWAQKDAKPVTVLTPVGSPIPGTPPILPDVYAWVDFSKGEGFVTPGIANPTFKGEAIFYEDVSALENGQHPETFVFETGVGVGGGWHHILLSWDLTGGPDGKGGTGEPPAKDAEGNIQQPDKDEPGKILAEATGDDPGPECFPGPYGQWPGTAQLGFNGAPFEDCGKYGFATGGDLETTCRAWLCVDGSPVRGAGLNHRGAYKGKYMPSPNAIVPPNAFLCLDAEIRKYMVTSLTLWERWYRTELGGFTGPPAKIEETNEKRRLDYERPKYEFEPGGLTSGPFGIPCGKANLARNQNIHMAELNIWTGISLNVEKHVDIFADGGKPAPIKRMDELLGSPSVRLHWATNWIKEKKRGEGEPQTDPPQNEAGFDMIGHIDRSDPFI